MSESLQNCIKTRCVSLIKHNSSRDAQLIAIARCAKNIEYWFDDWVWTYDPRREDVKTVPFVLFPRQREFLSWLQERLDSDEDGLGEKSRDMGFTWLCAGFLVHKWLFTDGFKGAIGSRKENLVDTVGDPDSIFEKMRILLRNLPGWMMPTGFDWRKHDNFCKLINPANGSVITGEAGDNIGRGGRNTLYIIDEAAFIERPQKVDAALSANTNCRIYISTPNGNGNPFAVKRASGDIPVFTMHWMDDPRKNAWELVDLGSGEVVAEGAGGTQPPEAAEGQKVTYPWYESEKNRLKDPVIIAQELDIDYTASVEGVCIPAAWVRAAVNLHWRMKLARSDNVIAGLDVADGGANESVLTIRRGNIIDAVYSRSESGTTDTAMWALDLARKHKAKYLNYDAPGVGAGITGAFKAHGRTNVLGVTVGGVNTGKAPGDALWPDGMTSKERFANLKAELWWIVRTRFEKTYEYVEMGIEHPADELISIPNVPKLINQLSNVKYTTNEVGKTIMESKAMMRSRSVPSPDYADSLILAFAPTKKQMRLAAGGERKIVTQYRPR